MTLGTGRTFTDLLEEIAAACEARLSVYLDAPSVTPDAVFRNAVTFALATMRGAREYVPLDDEDLRTIRDAATAAADVCRASGLDLSLLAVSAEFDRVAALCQRALGVRFP